MLIASNAVLILSMLLNILQALIQLLCVLVVIIRFGPRIAVLLMCCGLTLLMALNGWGVVRTLLVFFDPRLLQSPLDFIHPFLMGGYALGVALFLFGLAGLVWQRSGPLEVSE